MKRLLQVSLLSLCILVMPAVVFGSPVSGAWGGPGYSDFNAEFGFGHGFLWHTGDYWEEIVFGTGLTTVNSLALNLFFDNQLETGISQTFAVLLNSTNVGSFTLASGQTSFSNTFNFNSVAGESGTNYTIRLEQTSPDIEGPGGASQLILQESTYKLDGATATVPEPATLTLVLSGLGIGEFVRRRRNKAT
jgi:PEP-CTERM motif